MQTSNYALIFPFTRSGERMKQTINTRHVRAINQRTILDAIYQHPDGISRAELARSLNMSKPSMADNATALLDIGIIEEIGEDANTGKLGRKPVLLSFRSDFTLQPSIFIYTTPILP